MLAGVTPSMPVGEPVITTAPVFAVALIARDAVLAGEIHAGEVDADDLVPDRLRQLVDLAVARGEEDAGIGDEDVEPAEGLDHLL